MNSVNLEVPETIHQVWKLLEAEREAQLQAEQRTFPVGGIDYALKVLQKNWAQWVANAATRR